jgi:hypothetical protein
MTEKTAHPVIKMLEPFSANEINQIPKGGLKLDYVGHAALTKRLLETDLEWSWEPFAIGADGLPKLDEAGGLWIRLTVCGITRIGYGDAGNSKGTQAVKEAIGDALRNAGMRFGAALDLWHKGDLFDLADSRGDNKNEQYKKEPRKPLSVVRTLTPEQLVRLEGILKLIGETNDVENLRIVWNQEKDFLDDRVAGTTLKDALNKRVQELS